jgi:branched-chain amino acid transport system permease protein
MRRRAGGRGGGPPAPRLPGLLASTGSDHQAMSWDYLFIQATNGLIIGIIYAMIAAGVTLIFSILKIVNFAHGDLYMLGGYFAYYSISLLKIPPFAAVFVAVCGVALLGFILERLLLTPLYSDTTERKDEYGLIVTFGLAFFLRNIAVLIFGPFPLRPPSFVSGVQHVGNMIISNDRLVTGGAGILLILGLLYFMNRTIWGQALDAVSQSRDSAAIVGISPRRFNSAAFCIGAGLAAAAGALVAPIYTLRPDAGVLPNIHAYVIVILGGMGSVGGSILAGLFIGEAESLFTAYFPDFTRAAPYANAFGLLILMVVLIFRPQGFFGRRHLRME